MIQYRVPVRNNTLQRLVYSYKDQNGSPLDLTGFTSATVELKLQGEVYSTTAGSFYTPRTSGQVWSTFTFTESGIWDAQFVSVDAYGNRVFGEIVQFSVVPNVEDLTLSQLPTY